MADDFDRFNDVEMSAVMLQGAITQALHMMAGQWLRDAHVDQSTDSEGIVDNYTDVVLHDGWRIRFTRTVVPPGA